MKRRKRERGDQNFLCEILTRLVTRLTSKLYTTANSEGARCIYKIARRNNKTS